jgi:uncharacterized LabA/DUF88 family protein
MREAAIAYVDGYNWYHSIFKHYPDWKWLNLPAFFSALRPHEEIAVVKLFSSLVDPDRPASDARERQVRYFDALSTLPKMKIVLGAFQSREVHCRGTCRERYIISEEKKTDVNIAVEMISDAIAGACTRMYVVSGDSDIQPAVEWVYANKRDIKITVYIPALQNEQPGRRLDYYRTKGLSVDCKFLPLGDIKNHQLPKCAKLPNGKLAVRPHTWA